MAHALARGLLPLVALVLLACRTGEGSGAGTTAGTGSSAYAARLEEHYDSRNDRTLIRIVPPAPSTGAHLVAGVEFDGKQPKEVPGQVLITISWTSAAARFAGCDRVRWRGDDNLVAELEVTRDVQIGGGISEFLSGTVSFARAHALAAATHVSVDVCGSVLQVPDGEVDLLKQLVRRVSPRWP
jgi:hypothetical protein